MLQDKPQGTLKAQELDQAMASVRNGILHSRQASVLHKVAADLNTAVALSDQGTKHT